MKKFIIALMAFCLVFSLAGCGGGGGGGGTVEHWGDQGGNLPTEINKNYEKMNQAFDKSSKINDETDTNKIRERVLEYFTFSVAPVGVATFTASDGNKYNKNDMTNRLTNVLTHYTMDSYEFKPGDTDPDNDKEGKSTTKYTSWCYCVFHATNNKLPTGKGTEKNLSKWMLLTWEKIDGKWYITKGFEDVNWFKGNN